MKGGKEIKKNESTQNWLPYDKVLDNGIIIYNNSYIKIIKINPINYDLKSNLEKEAILNSYKIFLKTCNFDSQILIQSQKEDLSKHISMLKEFQKKYENKNILNIYDNYYLYISELNKNNKSSSKNFYIILKLDVNKSEEYLNEESIINTLKDMILKIKETISRCGNTVFEIDTKEEIEQIMFSFCNLRINK